MHGTHRPPCKCKLGVYIMTDEMHMHSRWSKERYKTAQASLVSILRDMNANGPASAILRPTLRDEARKSIGATGAHVLLFTSPFLQLHVYSLSGATCCRSRQLVRMLHLHRCHHFAVSPGCCRAAGPPAQARHRRHGDRGGAPPAAPPQPRRPHGVLARPAQCCRRRWCTAVRCSGH